jgi:hypothetical protein
MLVCFHIYQPKFSKNLTFFFLASDMTSKRSADSDSEEPVAKRLVPDFGGELPMYELAKREMRAFADGETLRVTLYRCAAHPCRSKVCVADTLCGLHMRYCIDCSRPLMSYSALRYAAEDFPVSRVFGGHSLRVYCSDCIKTRTQLPLLSKCVLDKYPVVVFRAAIGATGTDVTTSVEVIGECETCYNCCIGLVHRAKMFGRLDVGVVGGEIFCGTCLGINSIGATTGVTILDGTLQMSTTVARTSDGISSVLRGCLTCKQWECDCSE